VLTAKRRGFAPWRIGGGGPTNCSLGINCRSSYELNRIRDFGATAITGNYYIIRSARKFTPRQSCFDVWGEIQGATITIDHHTWRIRTMEANRRMCLRM
jgi:hypothetical protein